MSVYGSPAAGRTRLDQQHQSFLQAVEEATRFDPAQSRTRSEGESESEYVAEFGAQADLRQMELVLRQVREWSRAVEGAFAGSLGEWLGTLQQLRERVEQRHVRAVAAVGSLRLQVRELRQANTRLLHQHQSDTRRIDQLESQTTDQLRRVHHDSLLLHDSHLRSSLDQWHQAALDTAHLTKARLADQVDLLTRQNVQLHRSLLHTQADLVDKDRALLRAQDAALSLRAEAAALTATVDALSRDLDASKARVLHLENVKAAHESEVAKLQQQSYEHLQRFSRAQSQETTHMETRERYEILRQRFQEQIAYSEYLELDVERLKGQIAAYSGQDTSKQLEVDQCRRETQRFQEELAKAQREIEDLREELVHERTERKSWVKMREDLLARQARIQSELQSALSLTSMTQGSSRSPAAKQTPDGLSPLSHSTLGIHPDPLAHSASALGSSSAFHSSRSHT